MQDDAVGRQNKHLKVMRSGPVGSINSIAIRPVLAGGTSISLARDVPITADKVVLEHGKGGVRRERHGSQAIASASSRAVDFTQHVDPEDELAFLSGCILSLLQRLVPVYVVRQL